MPLRLEDAQCAVCMDNLFDLRDDLDEVFPIATPDCGTPFSRSSSRQATSSTRSACFSGSSPRPTRI
jgi:hypothetical protein